MSLYYNFISSHFANYAIYIIIFCFFVKLVDIPISVIRKKQQIKKDERNRTCKKLQEEYGDNQQVLADKIYEYYQKSNYNPILSIFSGLIMIVLEFLILSVLLGIFSPITNLSGIENETAQSIVSIYKDENQGVNRYVELKVLNNIDSFADTLKENGVDDKDIASLQALREKFLLGNINTCIIPSLSEQNSLIVIPIITLFLYIVSFLLNLVIPILRYKVTKNKLSLVSSSGMSVFGLVVTLCIIFNTPIIVSMYFSINYIFMIVKSIVKINRYRNSQKEGVITVEAESCITTES